MAFDLFDATGRKSPYPHQTRALELLRASVGSGHRRPCLLLPTGAGKCLGRDTPILMADGSIRPVQDIKVGDRLASPTGSPRTVLSLAAGREAMYRVTPVKGDAWTCNASHLLSLVRTPGGDAITLADGARIPPEQDHVVVRADVFAASNATARHLLKAWRPTSVSFEGGGDLPMPPYILGIWLGDGTRGRPTITKGPSHVVRAWTEYGASLGLGMSVTKGDRCPSYTITNGRNGGSENPVLRALRDLEVIDDKHIPPAYIRASREDRLELLAGLLDTDGHMSKAGYAIAAKGRALADDIALLARSVGLAAYVKPTIRGIRSTGFTGLYYLVSISGDCSCIPCRDKPAPARTQKKRALVTGLTVEPIGEGDYYGFELDGDRLFLLGDFTVTHNTYVAALIVEGALSKGNRVCFTVPAIELVDQTLRAFEAEGIARIGVMQADHPRRDPLAPVQVASVQTLARRERPSASVVVVDEAHLGSKVIREWMDDEPQTVFIGLTATPGRKGMAEEYDDLLQPVTMQDLIDAGRLSPYRIMAASHPDLSGVRTVRGDYHEGQIADLMSDGAMAADILQTWLKHGQDRPTLMFCVDRAHAKTMQERFDAAGVATGYIDAYTPTVERKVVLDRFRSGHIKVLANVGVLTTGFDSDVRCIIMARPTKSVMLYLQIFGRGLRTAEGKDHCLFLDHTDTALRLGFPTDVRFRGLRSGQGEADRVPPAPPLPKQCKACGFLKPPRVAQCPACGHKAEVHHNPDVLDVDLVEIERGGRPAKSREMSRDEKQTFWGMCLSLADQRGKSRDWAAGIYKNRTGVWPRLLDDTHVRPSAAFLNWDRARRIAYAKSRSR